MSLFKKKKSNEIEGIKSFNLGQQNSLQELPPLPDNESIDLENSNEDISEEEELEEIEEDEIEGELKEIPKSINKDIKEEKPIKINSLNSNEISRNEIMKYLIELRDYSLKLEEIIDYHQRKMQNYQYRIQDLEAFAFKVKNA